MSLAGSLNGYHATVKFRLVTWNMDWRGHRRMADSAWRYLREDLGADLALVQESVPPADCAGAVYRQGGIGPTRPWGSAVVSFGPALSEVTAVTVGNPPVTVNPARSFPGAVAVASVEELQSGGAPLVLVSMYGLLEGGYAITTVHQVLNDLTFLLDSGLGKNVIVGGDLNCSTQLTGRDRARHQNLFERFNTLGLAMLLRPVSAGNVSPLGCDCDDDPCQHVQTHRHVLSKKPWQDDYLFCTKALLERVESVKAVDAGPGGRWELSDHLPIVAEVNLAD